MGYRHSHLAASMAATWEAELVSARRLAHLAHQASHPTVQGKLLMLASFGRAHAARLLSRLTALGRGPLPVPRSEDEEATVDLIEALREELGISRARSARYSSMAELARRHLDLSTAWICELNRSEEDSLTQELERVLALLARSDHQTLPRSV